MSGQSDVAVLVNISTQKWPPRQRTYFGSLDVRSPHDGEAYALSGLSVPTKFDLRSVKELPYNEQWFRVPPGAPHGQTPKLGVLHPSLVRRAKAAFDAGRRRT